MRVEVTQVFGIARRRITITNTFPTHSHSMFYLPYMHTVMAKTTNASQLHPKRAMADSFRITMNKFLSRKKTSEGIETNTETYNELSSPPPTPGIKKSATSRWKKNKKQPEPKPEVNIAPILPTSNDFRMSLIMPNLSARFSMLREQDDPNSLIGKASDDSVLQPQRRSRMLDFGFGAGPNGLNDIAEVRSINGSIRPPFAYGRQDSYGSEEGYGSENEASHNGSMLSRARPGEGNVLFGGRQKIYKIPLGGASSTKLGKAVYEDDIGMSAFQRYRREREGEDRRPSEENPERQLEEDPGFDFGLDQTSAGDQEDNATESAPNDSAKDLSHSPSLSSYDKKRSTTSSTARSEARSSTAATSVASQPAANAPSPPALASQAPAPASTMPPLKRSDTKTRRLYEQGLDQHIHEQQTSALTRLNSIQRQRSLHQGKPKPPFLQTTKSAGNLYEKPSQPVYALRAQSPTTAVPLAPLTTFGSLRKSNSSNASPIASGPQSPISPLLNDFDDTNMFMQALEPGDRGKATAMGAFNKPAQQFDEQQYLERQQQLQRSHSKGAMRKDVFQQRLGRIEQIERNRSASDTSTRSRSKSAPRPALPRRGDSLRKKPEPTKAYNVFHKAASQISTESGAQQYDTHRTFFGNISASDSEEEDDDMIPEEEEELEQFDFGYGAAPARWQPTPLPSVSEHPALRGRTSKASLAEEDEEELEPQPLRPTPSSQSLRTDALNAQAMQPEVVDSPTLGPSSTEPLSGMMHHLRQKSNASSLYPNDDAGYADGIPEMPGLPWNSKGSDSNNRGVRNTLDSEVRVESTYTNSNPWDLDEIDNAYFLGDADRSPVSPVEGNQFQRQSLARAHSRVNVPTYRQPEVSQYSEMTNGPSWQSELRKQHTRDASTATQQERDAFANELAARRTAIQESIKSMVERETSSRNVSPAPSASGALKAFGMLRSKSSRESFVVGREPSAPSKAMKMLGIGASASNTNLSSQCDRSGSSLDVTRPRENSGSRTRGNSASMPPPMPTVQSRAAQANDWETMRARGDSETSRTHPKHRSPASSQASKDRSRSNSEVTTGRSRSRTGPYRDDLERAMVEGVGSRAAGQPELSPMISRELTPKPSPEIVQQNQFDGQPRARSNSRPPVVSNYFDAKNSQPIHTTPVGRLAPGGPSPASLSPNIYNPAGGAVRSPPAISPMMQNPTPPVSGANTPQGPAFTPDKMPIIQPRQGLLRKRTVSKHTISEPTLISSTSNVDTVDLPEGASLKNGMDEPPPVPPINPKRRGARKMFGLGRSEMSDDALNYGNFGRSKTPDPWMTRATPEPDFAAGLDARQVSNGRGVPQQGYGNHSTPALQQYGYQPGAASPERVERSPLPQHHGSMEGGMF